MADEPVQHQAEVKEKPTPPSVQKANEAWGAVGLRLRSTTPSMVVRTMLVLAITAVLIWLARVTWPALFPFILGGVIAYVLLPVVDALDRVLPRFLAILLTLAGVVAIIVYILAQILPLIGNQVSDVYLNLPSQTDLEEFVAKFDTQLATLPGPVANTINNILQETIDSAQNKLDASIRGLVGLGFAGIVTLINTVGFVLGFLVIPAWLLDVLRDHRTGVENIDRALPSWLRLDFWAVVRIIDRPFRAFVQGQVVLAFAAGVGIYLGLTFLEFLGWEDFRYKVLIAALVAMFQLIPTLGPIIAAVVLVLLGLLRSPEMAVTALILHIAVQMLVNSFVAPHVERRYIDIHPALLLMVIVLLSELGLAWVMIAAPLTAVVRDLYRYVYGRVSDPPQAAGILPGLPEPILPPTTLFSPFIPQQQTEVPLAYRRGRALRQPQTGTINQEA